jgi:decaprenylphospho-beta-D-ribofuranose 2-oxidase
MPREGEPRMLTGWGRTAPTLGFVSCPRSAADVERMLTLADRRGAIPRGLGRSYGDAAQNAGGLVMDMTGLRGVRSLDLEAGLVRVGAGESLGSLMRKLLAFGWFVPVTPGTRFVTVGGAIASDIHGKNHHRDGGFADHVTSMDLVTPDGDVRTLSPGGTPEEFRATAGGMGLTGVVVEATLRLIAVETAWMRVDTERAADLDDAMSRMESGDHRYRYSVAWIDCLATGPNLGRAVLTRGDHATLEELPASRRRRALRSEPVTRLSVPPGVPVGLLGRATARGFNEAWYRKAPRLEVGKPQPLAAFFHPLDGVGAWNRLYGPRGFVQYQLVVPFGAERTLRRVVHDMATEGCPSFLTVLKRFGPQAGFLSFPQAGWTLTLDIPAGAPGLVKLLDRFDRLVAEAGGRVYLAKDARLRPDMLAAMYPELDRWREVRERLDPNHVMRSDLGRRLDLLDGPPRKGNG